MPVDSRMLELMPDTITLFADTGVDKYGRPSWSGGGSQYRCRIMAEDRLTRTEQGDDVLITGRAVVYGPATVTTDYKLVLSDGKEPVIIAVDQIADEFGDHHTVITFGR